VLSRHLLTLPVDYDVTPILIVILFIMVTVILMTTIAASPSTCLILFSNTTISSIDANDVIHANADGDSSPGSSRT
jgi:ABC-type bacteriocin/lantibiotic exporter with double-glycine peptidase domain